MKPGATGDRAGLAALALAEGAPLPSAVGWDTTRDRCPAPGCGGIATAFIEPLTGRTMEGCTKCDRAVVLTGRTAPPKREIVPALVEREPRKAVVRLTHCANPFCGAPLTPDKRQYCSRDCYLTRVSFRGPRPCACGCGALVTRRDRGTRFASAACANRHRARESALRRAGEAA